MTRMRRLMFATASPSIRWRPLDSTISVFRRFRRQHQLERSAAAGAIAGGRERPAKFGCRQRRAVQTETVTGFAGGEPVTEQPAHDYRRDADAIVDHRDAHALR